MRAECYNNELLLSQTIELVAKITTASLCIFFQIIVTLWGSTVYCTAPVFLLAFQLPNWTWSFPTADLATQSVCPVTLVYCGQTARWITLKLGIQVGLGPGHIARWRLSSPSPKEQSPQSSAHMCCGQMVGWIKMPLGMEVGLGPGDC